MKIGVLSDTHGYFDPQIPKILAGVEHILHGGDIGPPAIIQQLEEIAPVTAVLGNTDSPLPGIRETEVIELGGFRFLIHHIVDPRVPSETVQRAIATHQPAVVIFGHTHKPFSQRIDGRLFFNPGYAGRQRFDLRRSLALLDANADGLKEETFWL